MKNIFYLLLLILVAASCKNKELCDDNICIGNTSIKVVVNWEDRADTRSMQMNIFSQTSGVIDYGIDNIPFSGEKTIKLVKNASYLPFCYDYYANVHFKDETNLETFHAYCAEVSRATYKTFAAPTDDEKTIEDPGGDFFVHSWKENFDVVFCGDCKDELILNFYPKNILRQFTYRINNIHGAKYIDNARGAISGMAAAYFFYADKLSTERSTVLFENSIVGVGENGVGYIEGAFYTFGPISPYNNRFTIEVLSTGKKSAYYTAWWDVSGQISESMANREAKLARDGYDILIENNIDTDIPDIPDPGQNPDSGSGFEIEVGDWDNVDVYL